MVVQYAVTIRRTKDRHTVTQEQYEQFMRRYDKHGVHYRGTNYETTGGLHVHTTAFVPDTFNPILFRTRGWNVKCVVIFNEEGWDNYKQKDHVESEPPEEFTQTQLKRRLFPKTVEVQGKIQKVKIRRQPDTRQATIDIDVI